MNLRPEYQYKDMCGRLIKAMSGARDAAANWEHAHTERRFNDRFDVGKVAPCLCLNTYTSTLVGIQGDDSANIGAYEHLDGLST